MHRLVHLFSALLFCCSMGSPATAASEVQASPAMAAAVPSRLQVSYNVIKSGIKAATITETFILDRNGYRIESISKAEGIVALFKPETITATSAGLVTAQGLRPLTFTNMRKLDSERNARADFDWAANLIALDDQSGKRTLPLPADTQDRLSAMYQFMYVPLKNTTSLDFHMTNGSKLDIYNYLITRNQHETVPYGKFKALYVASSPKENESQTEIWLATDHFNFPFKMVITDPDGDKLIQELTRFDFVP